MREFLDTTPWHNTTPKPIAGDASARRYYRLEHPPAILMDDPSLTTDQFAKIAKLLTNAGLCAPKIYAHDPETGRMIIEDLGTDDFAKHLLSHPEDEAGLYAAATDVLIAVSQIKPPDSLPAITHQTAADMIGLASDHYAPHGDGKTVIAAALRDAFDAHVAPDLCLALRDYHAENLIWRPQKSALDRVGLLDFQDACRAPVGYDLMSLIRDARRDVDDNVATTITARFCTALDLNPTDMSAQFCCIGVQRNLRILGIFARLAKRDGKVQYLDLIPRVWRCLMADLAHPALGALRTCVLQNLPAPDAATLQRLASK